jgi:hypothetical protein
MGRLTNSRGWKHHFPELVPSALMYCGLGRLFYATWLRPMLESELVAETEPLV